MFVAAISTPVFAAKCGNSDTILISCSTAKEDNAIWDLITMTINILAAGVITVAIGCFVYAAILYASAADNSGQVSQAKSLITNTVIGLVCFALTWSFLQFIIPGNFLEKPSELTNETAPTQPLAAKNNSSNKSKGKEPAATVCYTAAGNKSLSQIEGGKMYHYIAGDSKQTPAFENSPEGVRFAKNTGYTSIDIDLQMTKDGTIIATHWHKPSMEGFKDPLNKFSSERLFSSLTIDQVQRLRNDKGQRIYTLDEIARSLGNNNLNASLEIKDGPVRYVKKMPYIAETLNQNDVSATIKGLNKQFKGMNKAFEAAREAGFYTRGASGQQGVKKPSGNCK